MTSKKERTNMEEKEFKYYSTHRPFDLGTFPRQNMIDFTNYDNRKYVDDIGREAWGEITYSEPLTEQQLNDYEFVADPNNSLMAVEEREVTHGENIQKFSDLKQFTEGMIVASNRVCEIIEPQNIDHETNELRYYEGADLSDGEVVRFSLDEVEEVTFTDGSKYRLSQEEFDDLKNKFQPIRDRFKQEQERIDQVAKSIHNFYENSDEAIVEDVDDIAISLLQGNADEYINDLLDYKDSFANELSQSEVKQIYSLVNDLKELPYTNLQDIKKDSELNIAIESTKDFNDYYFQPNMNNTEGRGREDYYRIVYMNDYGDVQPFDNHVFGTEKEAQSYSETIKGVHTISYDELVNNTVSYRQLDRTKDLKHKYDVELQRLQSAMNLTGWKLRLAQGKNTYWYNDSHDYVTERKFDEFEDVQSYLEDVIINDKDIEKTFNSLVYGSDKNEISEPQKLDSITLFLKYSNPREVNGLHIENDRITFSSIEEMNKYVKGEVAYDVLDNAIKKGDNEILLYAENQSGEKIWTAENPHREESARVDAEKKGDSTKKMDNQNDGKTTAKDELLQKLQDGIKQTLDSEHFADWCKKQGKLYYNNYSLNNAMLTYLQKPEATYVCGYESWKNFGRQVKQGAQSIKVLAPVFAKEFGGKGSLLASIKKNCNEQLKKNPSLEYANYRLGQSKLSFNMYKNGLFDVKINDEVKMAHITSDDMRKFLDQSVIGKVPTYYNAVPVFDVSDTTDEVEFLWVSKDNCKKEEMVLDDNGNPITNKRGQVKIINTEERKARFNADIDMELKEQDVEKMQILYETLQKISNDKGIPMEEADPSKDEHMRGGALGYYQHATAEYPQGHIVISSELNLTDKVAVAFHETAHSDLHSDLDKLKSDMGNDVNVTKNLKEVQAEAVAYMTASTFGIETDHKSFNYIANWSDGRELKALENSLNVIYKESRRLLKEIETELDTKGLNMAFEPKDKTPLSAEEKNAIVTQYKDFMLSNMRSNESVQKSALEDYKALDESLQKTIVKEQIVLTSKIEQKLSSLNKKIDALENSSEKQEQVNLTYQLRAEEQQINSLVNKVNDLSEERVEAVREEVQKNKEDTKKLYADNPLKAMEQLQKDNDKMKDLSSNDLKYLATSKYISRNFSKYLGVDNNKFVDLSTKQLDNLKEVMSKNKTAVEISFCEQWGDEPIFKEGTVAHPKLANKIIESAEQQVRDLKVQAEKQGEYYPYSKCDLTIYTFIDNNTLTALNTRLDIGDKEQKNLTDHLSQICNKGQDKQTVLDNFVKATRERSNIQILTPQLANDKVMEHRIDPNNIDSASRSMSQWKDSMNKSNKEQSDDFSEEREKSNDESIVKE